MKWEREKDSEEGYTIRQIFFLMWLGKVHGAHIDAIVLICGPLVISEDATLELIISLGSFLGFERSMSWIVAFLQCWQL